MVCCGQCKYFEEARHSLEHNGTCHYAPPVLVVVGELHGAQEVSGFPRVYATDWCRCFEQKG
jgi:hypothetical protein